MKINDASLDAFLEDFMKTVEPLEKQYGVRLSLGTITYFDEQFSAKLTVTNGTSDEEIARARFDADVWKFKHLGFDKGMYLRIFTAKNGEQYAIEGFRPNAKKYPLEVIRIRDGALLRVSERYVSRIENQYYGGDCEVVEG